MKKHWNFYQGILIISLISLLSTGCASTEPFSNKLDLNASDIFKPLLLQPSHELFQLRIPLHMVTSTQKTQFENETWSAAGPTRKTTTQTTTSEIGYQNTTIYIGNGLSIDMTGNVFFDIMKIANLNLTNSSRIEYGSSNFVSDGENIVNTIRGKSQNYQFIDKTLYSFTKKGQKLSRIIEGENSISENVFGVFDNKTFTYVTKVDNNKLQITGLFMYGCKFELSEPNRIVGNIRLLTHPIRFNILKESNIIRVTITDGFLGSVFNKTKIAVVAENGIFLVYKDNKIISSMSIKEEDKVIEISYTKNPESSNRKVEVIKIIK